MNWLELLGFGSIIDFEKEDEGMEKEEIIERLVAFGNGWENPKSATPDFWEEVIEAVKVGDDAISRQAALDACNQSINLFEAADRIRELPPVKQEPCTDAISRKDALFAVRVGILSTATVYGRSEEGMATRREIEGALKALPPVNPAEKVGQWIEHFDIIGKWYECDQCHTDWGGSANYCPNCGAKMQEVKNNG